MMHNIKKDISYMDLLDFIAKYWSQMSIVFFALGYVLKSFFDFKIRKQEIKFSFINKERANVIKELHICIFKLSEEIELMAFAHTLSKIDEGPNVKQGKIVFSKIVELNKKIKDIISENKIYFSDSFTNLFETLSKNIRDNFIITSTNIEISKDLNAKFIFNDSDKFMEYFEKEFPEIKKRLLKEFRKHL